MQFIDTYISVADLKHMSEKMFGGLVKAVVDINQKVMVVDATLHVDEESLLLEEHGAQQEDLWGINLHPDKWGSAAFIEFDSMINMRPAQGNRSRGVDNPVVQEQIRTVVATLVKP